MKIAQFSTNDINGGAAVASYRLFLGLDKKADVDYFVRNKALKNENIIKLPYKAQENIVQSSYINKNRTKLSNTLFSFTNEITTLPDLSKYDIINLHWIEHFLSLENLQHLVNLKKPIIWTLHDQKPFTGGCHYTAGCERFIDDCINCKQLIVDEKKLPQTMLNLKKEIFKYANLTIVTPSKWLSDEARKSALFQNKEVFTIANSVDCELFKKRKNAKERFNIDKNSVVLSFGVVSHIEKRKGFDELYKALEIVKNRVKNIDIVGLIFGKNTSELPIRTIDVGYLDNEIDLSYIYSASDFFILPSLEDNLPNVILESMACGTPVVAFDTGGAKDIIDDSNGIIVPKGDINKLAESIITMIQKKELRDKKSIQARERILAEFQFHHQAEKYLELYNNLLQKPFKYQTNITKIDDAFDDLYGYIIRKYPQNNNLLFSKYFNNFNKQMENFKISSDSYIIYGNGTISKTIKALIPDKIVGHVDMAEKDNHPQNLKNLKYDKIIISVLGREESIVKYLVEELNICEDKIVRFDI